MTADQDDRVDGEKYLTFKNTHRSAAKQLLLSLFTDDHATEGKLLFPVLTTVSNIESLI